MIGIERKKTTLVTMTIAMAFSMLAARAQEATKNDYPTIDRLNYALDCIDRHGGPKIENLTACSCEIDKIAEKVSYEQFIDGLIYAQNKDMPGDKGGIFRDMAIGKDGYAAIDAARTEAEKVCFVMPREVVRKEAPAAEPTSE